MLSAEKELYDLSQHLNRELCVEHYQQLKDIKDVWKLSQKIDEMKR